MQLRIRPSEAFRAGGVRAAGLVLLLVLVAFPVPFGGIQPRGSAAIELLAFLCGAAAFATARPEDAPLGAAWIPAGLVLGIAALGAFQLLPLPAPLLPALSPVSARIHAQAVAALTAAGAQGLPQARISIAPTETVATLLLVLAYVAIFLASVRLLAHRAARRSLLSVLAVSTLAQVIWASLANASEDRIHGSFVNPNHFAGWLEIVLALSFGILWTEVLKGRDRTAGAKDRAEEIERRLVPLGLRILLWGAVAAGIGLTRSRGGVLAAGTTALVLLALALLARSGSGLSSTRRVIVLGVLSGALFAAAAAGEGAILRFLAADPRDIGTDFRLSLWRTSVRAFRDFPVLGSGLGTFREAFVRVQPRELPGLVEQAHADGLQILVTGGVVGAALAVAAFASLFVLLLRAWRLQRRREESALILAAFGALLSLTLHGLVDFSLSVPVIPATLACVLGAAFAAAADGRPAAAPASS